MNKTTDIDILKLKSDEYAHTAYKLARQLPSEEMFGLGSQLRRAALSVPLNIIEGYARQSKKSYAQFLKISYGSLKESQYIVTFAAEETLCDKIDANALYDLGDEIGRLLWARIRGLEET